MLINAASLFMLGVAFRKANWKRLFPHHLYDVARPTQVAGTVGWEKLEGSAAWNCLAALSHSGVELNTYRERALP